VNAVSALRLVETSLRRSIGVRRDRAVLIEGRRGRGPCRWGAGRRTDTSARSADRRVRGLGALLVARIAAREELCVWIAREQCLAERIRLPVRDRARLAAQAPRFGSGSKTCTLYRPLSLCMSWPPRRTPCRRKRHARIAVRVVEHVLRIAVLGNAARFIAKSASSSRAVWNLPLVLKASGLLMSNQELPLHCSVRLDARRNALTQTLPHQIAAIGQPLNESSAERAAPRARTDRSRAARRGASC